VCVMGYIKCCVDWLLAIRLTTLYSATIACTHEGKEHIFE